MTIGPSHGRGASRSGDRTWTGGPSFPTMRRGGPGAPICPVAAPAADGDPSICPHCWMVNPGPFRLCARCGASMHTLLQESAGLRRTAPVQSPVPVVGARLSLFQRGVMAVFVLLLALLYLSHLLPLPRTPQGAGTVPTSEGL